MKPKNQICKCGHEEKEHYNKQFPAGKIFMCVHFDKKYCGCKKYEPQYPLGLNLLDCGCMPPERYCVEHKPKNHSQDKINRDEGDSGLSASPGTLSSKRKELFEEMRIPLTTHDEFMLLVSVFDFIAQQDKDFIKKLKEVFVSGNWANYEVHNEIDKLAGSELVGKPINLGRELI